MQQRSRYDVSSNKNDYYSKQPFECHLNMKILSPSSIGYAALLFSSVENKTAGKVSGLLSIRF